MKSVPHGMGPVWGRSRKCLALELWPLLNRKLGGQGAKVGLRWGQAFKSPIKQGRIGLKTHFGRLSIPSPVYYSNITSYVTFYYLLSYRYRWGCHPKYIVRFLVKLLVFTNCYKLSDNVLWCMCMSIFFRNNQITVLGSMFGPSVSLQLSKRWQMASSLEVMAFPENSWAFVIGSSNNLPSSFEVSSFTDRCHLAFIPFQLRHSVIFSIQVISFTLKMAFFVGCKVKIRPKKTHFVSD